MRTSGFVHGSMKFNVFWGCGGGGRCWGLDLFEKNDLGVGILFMSTEFLEWKLGKEIKQKLKD